MLRAFGDGSDIATIDAHARIGPSCDPADPRHAVELRLWLNRWTCRIRIPPDGEADPFVTNLADWWKAVGTSLPDDSARLAGLTDHELGVIAAAYGALVTRTAAVNRVGQRRSFGPTATAKLLYFLRPLAVTPWDKAISRHVPGLGEPAFLEHLRVCRGWANDLIAEAGTRGVEQDEIGRLVGRPLSSVAKLIDEWLYQTITAGAGSAP